MSGSEAASGSKLAQSTGSNESTASSSGSHGTTHPEVPTREASSDEDQSLDSASAPRMMSLHRLLMS